MTRRERFIVPVKLIETAVVADEALWIETGLDTRLLPTVAWPTYETSGQIEPFWGCSRV
jgi:hypothetical protein